MGLEVEVRHTLSADAVTAKFAVRNRTSRTLSTVEDVAVEAGCAVGWGGADPAAVVRAG